MVALIKTMNIRRIVPDITSIHFEESKRFYSDFIGLTLAMEMEWILTFISETNPMAQINIIKSQGTTKEQVNFGIAFEGSMK